MNTPRPLYGPGLHPAIFAALLLVGWLLCTMLVYTAVAAVAGLLLGVSDVAGFVSDMESQRQYPYAMWITETLAISIGSAIPVLIYTNLMKEAAVPFGITRTPAPLLYFMIPLLVFTIQPLVDSTHALNSWLVGLFSDGGIGHALSETEQNINQAYEAMLTISGPLQLTMALLATAVAPAVAEEFLFRGTLQPLVQRWVGRNHAGIWITAFLFSAIHGQVSFILPRFVLGLFLGYLFQWTRCIWYPVVAHFLNNAAVVLLAYYSSSMALHDSSSTEGMQMGWHVISFLIFAVALLIFYKRSRTGADRRRRKELG